MHEGSYRTDFSVDCFVKYVLFEFNFLKRARKFLSKHCLGSAISFFSSSILGLYNYFSKQIQRRSKHQQCEIESGFSYA